MIGNVIQTKRKAVGLTQAQLAELLGVSAPAVNKWEKDLCFPDVALLAPLARLLKTDLNELFSFYSVLSDKERELVVDAITMHFINDGPEPGLKYIDEVLKQNPADGLLLVNIADTLYGFHILAKEQNPKIYLQEVVEFYNRALELVPEQTDKIAYSLMNVYSEIGDREKAEFAWSRMSEAKYNKKYAHSEMLFNLKEYDKAASEIKEIILRKIVDLSGNLSFLFDNLILSGDEKMAAIASEKKQELHTMFGLWDGINAVENLSRVISDPDKSGLENCLSDLFQSCIVGKSISDNPLFEGVVLPNDSYEKDRTNSMAELMLLIKDKSRECALKKAFLSLSSKSGSCFEKKDDID